MKFVREIVKEVCGLAPYEKRLVELLRVQKEKRALKFAKRRVRRRTISTCGYIVYCTAWYSSSS